MQHLFENMTATCDELAKLMADRGIIMPSAAIEARSGHRTARVMLNFAKAGESYPGQYEFLTGDTIEEAVEKAEAWIRAQPTAEERALQDALDMTAKALEASRKAGLDTDDGAAFVAQLVAMMKRLSENAITDHRSARGELMARGTATHNGEELEVAFSATGQLTDYGVDRSPTWIEWEDIEIEELTILGHKVDPKILPDELVEAIRELADDLEFEAEEPDYD